MTRPVALAQAEREVVRQCHRGLDVATVQREVLRSLRRVIPMDAAFFATADPDTLLMTGAFAEEPLAAATPMFLANEFGCVDVNKFSSLALAPNHVATLDHATGYDRPSSLRSRDIMRPLGLGDELRAALVAGSQCWGYLCLHRDDRPLGFTSLEAAVVARLAPHIAHALRQAIVLDRVSDRVDLSSPGIVLLSADLTVVAMTAEAEQLLSLVEDRGSTKFPVPLAVYTVAMALRGIELGEPSAAQLLSSTRVQTMDGRWLRVHASRLHGADEEDRIAVVVEPVGARDTVPLLLSAYGLSPREAEVAKLVLRGVSTRAIVDTLHISRHTVQDHLKAVFDKTGVHSRRELVGRLLSQPRPPEATIRR